MWPGAVRNLAATEKGRQELASEQGLVALLASIMALGAMPNTAGPLPGLDHLGALPVSPHQVQQQQQQQQGLGGGGGAAEQGGAGQHGKAPELTKLELQVSQGNMMQLSQITEMCVQVPLTVGTYKQLSQVARLQASQECNRG
jgi:hypothetical protein